MKRNYYIFSHGRLLRHQNTVYLHQYEGERQDDDELSLADGAAQAGCVLEDLDASLLNASLLDASLPDAGCPLPDTGESLVETDREHPATSNEHPAPSDEQRVVLQKRPVPIEDVEAFYIFGEMDFNTKLLNFLARHRVPVHIFNYFGFYSSTIMPRQEINSGYLLVHQVEHYSQKSQRLILARSFIDGASFNILKNLRYYGAASRGRDMSGVIASIEAERALIATAPDIATLMGIEGRIRYHYYNAWPIILSAPWAEFTRRVKRPPDNPINALISFGNSLCYTLALGEIYRTPLSPLISFLHEPGERRYSLALDIAEIFKPILADRLIFKLINNGEVRPQHFEEKLNFCYLKESGRKIVLQAWDERLKQTIEHRNLGKKVSYRRLVRLECYRLKKHLLDIDPYEPFKIWW
ncbi:MAG: type I-B CRISPR-associated endonuclease Cas1b [Armatimonadota bacterium]|nr:type I-B CRISPR-associated endonuclease Cas1b [Armatimonadota bacterium]